MADSPASLITDYLRTSVLFASATDASLLADWVQGDRRAFEAIVQRHGPMVLGACRRVLGPGPDADDAFQAAFLMLARSARTVHGNLPGWLHRVAWRTAIRMRRRRQSAPLVDPIGPDPFAAVEWRDVRTVLDAEINRLPDSLRSPLVLCYLDGQTRDEAALQLGWSLRTLHRRLERARLLLRERLSRRGVASLLLGALAIDGGLRAAVPRDLLDQAIANALQQPPRHMQLLPTSVSFSGGTIMKLAMMAAALVGAGMLIAWATPSTVAEQQTEKSTPAKKTLEAKVPPRLEKRALARQKAIDYLLKNHKVEATGERHWESNASALQQGGTSALVLLSLLEAGVKPTNEIVAGGLESIRRNETKSTYVLSLQVQALCKANLKKDADLVRQRVDLLAKGSIPPDGRWEGWTYFVDRPGRSDNSNTRYAIAALLAAHQSGIKVDADLWKNVREHYLKSQSENGGWGYTSTPGSNATHTMTLSALFCLSAAEQALADEHRPSKEARARAEKWLVKNFAIESRSGTYYNLDVMAAFGRVADSASFGNLEPKKNWLREGRDWLIAKQRENGEFGSNQSGIDQFPVLNTAFALRFLATEID